MLKPKYFTGVPSNSVPKKVNKRPAEPGPALTTIKKIKAEPKQEPEDEEFSENYIYDLDYEDEAHYNTYEAVEAAEADPAQVQPLAKNGRSLGSILGISRTLSFFNLFLLYYNF